MEHLLRGTARRGTLDLSALAASLAEGGDDFDDDWNEQLVRLKRVILAGVVGTLQKPGQGGDDWDEQLVRLQCVNLWGMTLEVHNQAAAWHFESAVMWSAR